MVYAYQKWVLQNWTHNWWIQIMFLPKQWISIIRETQLKWSKRNCSSQERGYTEKTCAFDARKSAPILARVGCFWHSRPYRQRVTYIYPQSEGSIPFFCKCRFLISCRFHVIKIVMSFLGFFMYTTGFLHVNISIIFQYLIWKRFYAIKIWIKIILCYI